MKRWRLDKKVNLKYNFNIINYFVKKCRKDKDMKKIKNLLNIIRLSYMIWIFLVIVSCSIAEESRKLFSIEDLRSPDLWKVSEKVKIDTKNKKGIYVTIPAEKNNNSIYVDLLKIRKMSWDDYASLQVEIDNVNKESLQVNLILVRRQTDSNIPIEKEHPKFNKNYVIKPGKNIIKMDTKGASNSWIIGVEGIEFVIDNKYKEEKSIYINKLEVTDEEIDE